MSAYSPNTRGVLLSYRSRGVPVKKKTSKNQI
jgi:hypothetical protein